MSDLHRARARAEEFARAVDSEPRHSSRRSDDDPELTTAVDLAERLRTAGSVVPRPEFTAELRHRLLEQAAARAATTPTVVPTIAADPDHSDAPDDDATNEADDPQREDDDSAGVTRLRPRHARRIRLVASTAALVLLGGGIGSAAAAQQAMPGDTLYGVKRSIENVSTNVSVGDDSRGRRELEHAMTRISEVRALVAAGGDIGTVNSTLDDFSAQARRGVSRLVASYQQTSDATAITAITSFLTTARQAFADLAPQLPAESLKAAVEALATIEQLARHTAGACPSCAKPGAVTTRTPTTSSNQGGNAGEDPSKTFAGPTVLPSKTSTQPTASRSPGHRPATSPVRQSPGTSRPPEPTGTPSAPPSAAVSVPTPSQPPLSSIPTPSATPNWPWPFPSLPLPLPLPSLPINLPLLTPPWR